jgi:AI-2 transport protein TqsA
MGVGRAAGKSGVDFDFESTPGPGAARGGRLGETNRHGDLMTTIQSSAGIRFLIGAAAFVVLVAGLRAAAPILVPLVLALFITVINFPLLQGLRRLRVPTPIAVLCVVLLTFSFVGLVVMVGTASLSDVGTVLPVYLERLRELELAALLALESRGVPVPEGFYNTIFQPDRLLGLLEPERLLGLVGGVVGRAAGFFAWTAIVLLFTIFMLSEATGFPTKLRAAIGRSDVDLSRLGGAVRDIQRYLAIKTAISLTTGALVALWLWFLGVDFPILWGMLAFLFNYVPNVGSLIAAVPAVLFATLQLGPWSGVLAATGYLVVNIGLGNLVEPHLMGRRFGLSTLVVVVSLVFWGWVWGPVGMLLSVPLTVVVRIGLEYTDDLRWLAQILSNQSAPITDPAGAGVAAGAPVAGDRPALTAGIEAAHPATEPPVAPG